MQTQLKRLSRYEDFVSTGPGTLNGRYLRQFWFPVYRSDMLARGSAKPIRILSEDFTLYRGQDGTPHVVAQRCPHRGTQLSVGFVEDDCVRCLYHGWKFDGTGQCVEMPAEGPAFAEKVRIRACPTGEHLGLVFAYFGTGEPPPFPHIPPFAGDGIIENTENLLPCNFFQGWENDWDEFHAAFTHRTGLEFRVVRGDGFRRRATRTQGRRHHACRCIFVPDDDSPYGALTELAALPERGTRSARSLHHSHAGRR